MIVHTDDHQFVDEMRQAMADRRQVSIRAKTPRGSLSIAGYVWTVCDDHTDTPVRWTIDFREEGLA
jgi:hypothetical protein